MNLVFHALLVDKKVLCDHALAVMNISAKYVMWSLRGADPGGVDGVASHPLWSHEDDELEQDSDDRTVGHYMHIDIALVWQPPSS